MKILDVKGIMKEVLNKNIHIDVDMAFALHRIYEKYQYFIGFKDNEFYRINMEDEDIQEAISLEDLINLSIEYNAILEERYKKYGEYDKIRNNKIYSEALRELKKSYNSIPVWSMTYYTRLDETHIKTVMFKSYKEMYDFYINDINNEILYLYDEINEENKKRISNEQCINLDFVESYYIFEEDFGYYEHNMDLNVLLINEEDLQNI